MTNRWFFLPIPRATVRPSNGCPRCWKAYGDAAPFAEIFPLPGGNFGISIPSKVVDDMGEQIVLGRISAFAHFDLWAGEWKSPK